jgi:phage FluMu gp28-like protein
VQTLVVLGLVGKMRNRRCMQNAYEGLNMHKRMSITLDEAVYEGLYRTISRRRMSQFIENLLRPHVLDPSLDEGYRAMASDTAREAQAQQWCDAQTKDTDSEAR